MAEGTCRSAICVFKQRWFCVDAQAHLNFSVRICHKPHFAWPANIKNNSVTHVKVFQSIKCVNNPFMYSDARNCVIVNQNFTFCFTQLVHVLDSF